MQRSTVLYIASLVALVLALAAPHGYALPNNEVETIYYADATAQEEVGYSFLGCDGTFFREGRGSRYRSIATTPCHDVPTPPDQPAGMCYYNLQTGQSGCCTWVEGDCPPVTANIIITSITP